MDPKYEATHFPGSLTDEHESVPVKTKISIWDRFAKNVSIAGIQELYEAENKWFRLMWAITLLAAAGSIVYHTILLIDSHFNQKQTFAIEQKSQYSIPFPNVTACIPAGINMTKIGQLIRIPPKVAKWLLRLNTKEREFFFEESAQALSYSFSQTYVNKPFGIRRPEYSNIKDVITFTLLHFGRTLAEFYKETLPTCEQSISNCYFNGKPYGCCEKAAYVLSEGNVCFEIPAANVDLETGQKRSPWSPVSLNFDLTMDWRHVPFYAEDATDGFSLHLADPVCLTGRPIAIPGGMHTVVEMARPMHRIDIRDCISSNFPRTHFGHYDSVGAHCLSQEIVNFLKRQVGCYPPFHEFMPNMTEGCMGTAMLLIKMALTGQLDQLDTADHAFNEYVHKQLTQLYHGNKTCLPICTRWIYEPRPSFSRIKFTNDVEHLTRSRITVRLSSEFYDERTEAEEKPFYDTFYNIGFAMSMYAGLSMISLAEILFYGFEIFFIIRKRRKTADADANKADAGDSSGTS